MKTTLQLLGLGLFMMTLSSCDTYVGAGGYAGARPGYYNRGPAPRPYYHPGYTGHHNGNYGHNHPSYYSRPGYRPAAGVNAGVNARVLPLNVNSNTRLGIF
jgi:hypothetical protein